MPSQEHPDIDSDSLHYRDKDGAERRFLLPQAASRVLLGRSSRCDLSLPWDDELSRAHCVLEHVGDDWLVADDGMSRNGTYVNGKRLTGGLRLQHEDRLRVGSTVITFRCSGPPATKPTVLSGSKVAVTEAQRLVLLALCRPLLEGRSVVPATNREIAHHLHLAEDTVKDHLKELFRRFRLDQARPNEKRQQLAARARDAGLI